MDGSRSQRSSPAGDEQGSNLAESIRFYTTTLGCTLEFQYEDFYAGMRAGQQLFHLKLVDEKDPSIAYVDGDGRFQPLSSIATDALSPPVQKTTGV